MKNKGQLGEFHWSGFAIAFVLCLAFALTAYTRFKFSQEAPNQDLKTRIELLEEEVRDLQRQSKEIKVCPVVPSLPVAQSIKSTAEHKKIPAVGAH